MTLFNKDYDYIFKLLIIGDSYVGKSSLLSKYVDNIFDENFNATIGVDFKSKHLDIDDKMVKLQIWDSSGEKIFKSISCLYYKNCHGIMLVFDLTNRKSFQNVKTWLKDIKEYSRVDDIPKILIGNKTDKVRIIPYEEIIEEEYNKRYEITKNIDFSKILKYELEDETEQKKASACAGGNCEL
jgi:small GTP-binding protein